MKTSPQNNKKKKRPKKKIFLKYMQAKLAFLFITVTLALLALSFVMSGIVRDNGENYKQIVLAQQDYDSTILPYRRGDIIDRNGTYLATSERIYTLIIDGKIIMSDEEKYKEVTLKALVEVFGYDKAELEEVLEQQRNKNYYRYKKEITHEQMEAFEAYKKEANEQYQKAYKEDKVNNNNVKIHGIWFEVEYKRIYPNSSPDLGGSVASHLIGFSRNSDEAFAGGLEQQYNKELTGTNGKEYGYLNSDGVLERVTKEPINGNKIVATIDINIQRILEKHIAVTIANYTPLNVAAVAMDPNTGEILGMASNRSYDLNDPFNLAAFVPEDQLAVMSEEDRMDRRNKVWRNFMISDAYEPGSTSKIFTVASGLEEGIFGQNDSYYCESVLKVGGWDIYCYGRKAHGQLTLTETLMKSCNVAMMKMGVQMGKERFSRYQQLFGFGEKTGIDLPGEAKGQLHALESMGETDLATNTFGQNFTVTMVQMAAAYASAINGGYYYEPHVVKKILDNNGGIIKNVEPNLVRETVSSQTSDFIKNALFQTVEGGTGTKAYIEGYQIGGKTGTAEKFPRDKTNYILSFCGFAPLDNPEILLYVIVDSPNAANQASSVFATETFRSIMEELLPYVNIFSSTEMVEEVQPEEVVPEEMESQTEVHEIIEDEIVERNDSDETLPGSIPETVEELDIP